MPPISCTSKCRSPSDRSPASRTTAKASGRSWSRVWPSVRRCLNSGVLAASCSSLSALMSSARALICLTTLPMRLSSRSLRVPNTFFSTLVIITFQLFELCTPPDARAGQVNTTGGGLVSAPGAAQITRGIDRAAVFEYFVVHMGTRGTTAAAHQGNRLTLAHNIARGHQILLVMSVAGDITVAVGNFHHLAVSALTTGPGHHAGRHRQHIGAFLAGKIDTVVHRQ